MGNHGSAPIEEHPNALPGLQMRRFTHPTHSHDCEPIAELQDGLHMQHTQMFSRSKVSLVTEGNSEVLPIEESPDGLPVRHKSKCAHPMDILEIANMR